MNYRVFVGYWGDTGPLWAGAGKVDIGGLSWWQARDKLMEHLVVFRNDDCACCRDAATGAVLDMILMEPGDFQAEVDGTDYMILEEETNADIAARG